MITLIRHLFWVGMLVAVPGVVSALELQGVVTRQCRTIVGLPIQVTEQSVVLMNLDGRPEALSRADIDTVAIYNVIENPFSALVINEGSLPFLKELYLDDSEKPVGLVFAVRFIEDLVIFMSLDGQSHVHRLKDIDRLRPANESRRGVHRLQNSRRLNFIPPDSEKCPNPRAAKGEGVRATRVLTDKISIAELYDSFTTGYEALESFQERTYLYAKPFLYPKESRLGILLGGRREEAGPSLPLYFQWSSGEPYRFQSFNVFGGKPNEFTPNAEPIFAIRSDVKSHIFHGLFVGNIFGMPAGESIFLGSSSDLNKLKSNITVQPSFNYLAMMGGDYGPYSLSMGFFYPTFGIRVGDQEREILGSSLTYALRAMYTTRRLRLRAITSLSDYKRNAPSKEDVLVKIAGQEDAPPSSFEFRALFLRPGIDYDFTDELRVGGDLILVDGNYNEVLSGLGSDMQFRRMTTQFYVQQSFGDYITLIGYLDLLRHSYKGNFTNTGDFDKTITETRYFGTLEFVF
jgi:hypothetical protein